MSLQAKLDKQPPYKLLACDGGGIRGIISVEILARIEDELRTLAKASMRSGFSRSFPHMSSRWIQSSTSRKCSVSDLWDRRDKLTSEAVVRLALALRETGRPDDAMKLLEQHAENDTDAMGTLAGQFKRRWLLEDTKDDAERA